MSRILDLFLWMVLIFVAVTRMDRLLPYLRRPRRRRYVINGENYRFWEWGSLTWGKDWKKLKEVM